jgi:hypothetical protein
MTLWTKLLEVRRAAILSGFFLLLFINILLVSVTMQTGLVTSLFATADIVAFLADVSLLHTLRLQRLNSCYSPLARQLLVFHFLTGRNFFCWLSFSLHAATSHLIFNMPLSKLYTNSLMSTLNARSGTKYMMSSNITTLGNVQSLDVSKLTSPGRAEVRQVIWIVFSRGC